MYDDVMTSESFSIYDVITGTHFGITVVEDRGVGVGRLLMKNGQGEMGGVHL